jgi:C1A family cysteine protease
MGQYGLIRQEEDARDYRLPRIKVKPMPRVVNLRKKCPPVFDQGTLGSCTANAGAAARMMLTGTPAELSRLFLYYQERALHGNEGTDSGASMRDICKALKKDGICEERYAPYDIDKFADRPSDEAYENALQYKIASYATFDGDAADDIQQIRRYLATARLPVLIGMDIYESFETPRVAKTGIVPMPDTAKEKLMGKHAVLIVGYNDIKRVLIVRNSWGTGWGDRGYFYLPYNYVKRRFAYDTWTITA